MRIWLHEIGLDVIGAVDLEETPQEGSMLIINSTPYQVFRVCRRIVGEDSGNYTPSTYGIVVGIKRIPIENDWTKSQSNWTKACFGGMSYYDNVRRDDTLLWGQ